MISDWIDAIYTSSTNLYFVEIPIIIILKLFISLPNDFIYFLFFIQYSMNFYFWMTTFVSLNVSFVKTKSITFIVSSKFLKWLSKPRDIQDFSIAKKKYCPRKTADVSSREDAEYSAAARKADAIAENGTQYRFPRWKMEHDNGCSSPPAATPVQFGPPRVVPCPFLPKLKKWRTSRPLHTYTESEVPHPRRIHYNGIGPSLIPELEWSGSPPEDVPSSRTVCTKKGRA